MLAIQNVFIHTGKLTCITSGQRTRQPSSRLVSRKTVIPAVMAGIMPSLKAATMQDCWHDGKLCYSVRISLVDRLADRFPLAASTRKCRHSASQPLRLDDSVQRVRAFSRKTFVLSVGRFVFPVGKEVTRFVLTVGKPEGRSCFQ